MFEDNLDKTKIWAEDSSEAQSVQLRGVEPDQGSSDTAWMSDDERLDKLNKYVNIKGGGTITKDDTIWELCERFNRSRDYLVELALEEETKAINRQTFKSLNLSLQEDNGEPDSELQPSEPRFGKAGGGRPIETRRGTRSGTMRDKTTHSTHDKGKRVHFASHDCVQFICGKGRSYVGILY
jgi:hypothetical protein